MQVFIVQSVSPFGKNGGCKESDLVPKGSHQATLFTCSVIFPDRCTV